MLEKDPSSRQEPEVHCRSQRGHIYRREGREALANHVQGGRATHRHRSLHQARTSTEMWKMKVSRSRTMSTKSTNNIEGEETVVAFVDGIPRGDTALVAAAKNGSRKAFEILVKRHQEKIFLVARRITRRREDAEDVVQQSFQKAFTHLRKFEGRSAFSTWWRALAITKVFLFLRRGRSLREVFIDDLNGNEETTTPLEFPDSSLFP